ncbi:hypothetical protein E2C01_062262 [Portunus trituberculatus]|uniref:PH domain-containing protein n=1 Tax=Portunus trituberculatus TaxID=210409 RepID=A0A5B7H5Z7_PORTR|nr:hypothetical protein [Portunus trituberculatus]
MHLQYLCFYPQQEPWHLSRCVVAWEGESEAECFEVSDLNSKDTFIFKGSDAASTESWFRYIQFHALSVGTWKRRRPALANIMINGMGRREEKDCFLGFGHLNSDCLHGCYCRHCIDILFYEYMDMVITLTFPTTASKRELASLPSTNPVNLQSAARHYVLPTLANTSLRKKSTSWEMVQCSL